MFWWRQPKQQKYYTHPNPKYGKGNQDENNVEVVLAIHRVANEAHAAREQGHSQERKKSNREIATILFIALTAGFAGWQAVLFRWSMSDAREIADRQHADTLAALELAATSNQLSKDTAVAQIKEMVAQSEALRDQLNASIAVQSAAVHNTSQLFSCEPKPRGGINECQIGMVFINSGGTFTKTAKMHVNFWDTDTPMPSEFAFKDLPDAQVFSASFPPHEPHPVVTKYPGYSNERMKDFKDERRHLYIYGQIEYEDIFPNTLPHITKFCTEMRHVIGNLDSDPATSIGGSWLACPHHNCADQGCAGEQ